jgi:hypothetical protein
MIIINICLYISYHSHKILQHQSQLGFPPDNVVMVEIHEQKPIILNTNLEFSRWTNVLYDEQMTAALVGRLMHHCHLLLFPGENNRLRESSINELYGSITAQQRGKGE